MTEKLPLSLREQVLGYAESVERSAPSIAKDAGVSFTSRFEDHIVFVAGLRKLFSIVSSSYWSLDNSTALLSKSNTSVITIAGRSFSRGSEAHEQLRTLLADLEDALSTSGVMDLMRLSLQEVAEAVANELS